MRLRILAFLTTLCLPAVAWANCAPFPILDGGGSSTNFASATDGSSNCFLKHFLVDSTGANAYPAAAALSDAMSNPTTILFGTMNMLWDSGGSQWHRWAEASAGVPKMDLTSIGGTATVTGGVNGLLATAGAAASGATQSGNPVKVGGVFNTTQPTVTNGQAVDSQFTARGAALVATGVDAFTVQPGNTANTTPWLAKLNDGTSSFTVKAASTNAATGDTAVVVAPSPNPSTVCTSVINVSQTTSTDLKTSTNKLHICSITLISDTAQFVSIVEGTGSVCATGTAALWGATTAANGMSFGTNGGFNSTASRPFGVTQTTADHLCILQSGSGRLSGAIWYTDHA